MMVSELLLNDIYMKLKSGEFGVVSFKAGFKILGCYDNQIKNYTNVLAFLASLKVKFGGESVEDFVKRTKSDDWMYVDTIKIQAGGFIFAGELLQYVADLFNHIKGFESISYGYPSKSYPPYHIL